ncbi:glycosyltransferase [Actinokineospora pegani]|uniref:glycosyltransferase n=1 Tax=Actinokineospora pegani TaxID=2654637 RepID=UPI0012EA9BC2|nr:glycosyltransferase [Actinokineospora pegani]
MRDPQHSRTVVDLVCYDADPLADPGGPGGSSVGLHVRELASALGRLGCRVTVLTRRAGPEGEERGSGFTLVRLPAGPAEPLGVCEAVGRVGEFAEGLRQRWRRSPPTVVHAHSWMSGLASALATPDLDVPVIQTFHGLAGAPGRTAPPAEPPQRRGAERVVAQRARLVLATSTEEVEHLAVVGVTRRSAAVIPGGVDLAAFTVNPTRFAAPASARTRTVLAAGRFTPESGLDAVVAALALVPDAGLVLLGGDPGSEGGQRVRDLAERVGVTRRVRFAGRVPHAEVPALLSAADLVVSAPEYEHGNGVVVEAMACGTPVLALPVGGLADAVVDEITGVHLRSRAPRHIAARLRSLLDSPLRREALGLAGADRASSRYSWDRVAAETLRVYLEQGPAPGVVDTGLPEPGVAVPQVAG